MTKSSKAGEVFSNPVLISKIISNLRYESMKSYREVNKLWRFEVTKLTRPITRVCVNEDNIDSMLYGSTVLGLSLHIRWSSIVSQTLRNILQKYARYIQTLSWFVDNSSSIDHFNGRSNDKWVQTMVQSWDLQDLVFPKVADLFIILTDCRGGPAHQYGIIRALLHRCPNIEKLRIEAFGIDLSFTYVLQQIHSVKLDRLVSLHIGKGIQVQFSDFRIIKNMSPKVQDFIWEAPITFDPVRFHSTFQGLWMQSLHSLELNSPPLASFPVMSQLRKLSLTSASFTNTSLNLSVQFPVLKDLAFSLQLDSGWTTWIPSDMTPHVNIHSLSWTSYKRLNTDGRNCLRRLIGKLPNLKSLTCPADDNFLHVICKTVPRLKKLKIHGDQCSDSGVTGISLLDLYQIAMTVNLSDKSSKIGAIESFKKKHGLYDLKELEDLTLMHTGVTDVSVSLAISGMKKLRKLHISGITMMAIWELLSHPKLIELGVPQPIGKTVSFEDIITLRNKTLQIKIVTGWDSEYIQSCSMYS